MAVTEDRIRGGDTAAQMGRSAREAGNQTNSALEPALHQEPLQGAWEAMEKIPVGAYYLAVAGSIAAALGLYVSGKKDSAQFVGQWAPTFALLGLMNRLLRPAQR